MEEYTMSMDKNTPCYKVIGPLPQTDLYFQYNSKRMFYGTWEINSKHFHVQVKGSRKWWNYLSYQLLRFILKLAQF